MLIGVVTSFLSPTGSSLFYILYRMQLGVLLLMF